MDATRQRASRGPTRIGGHTARKRFGQHFLTDTGVIAEIVAAVDPRPGQPLVEIGPGLGALTWPVLDRAGRLTVVELDRDLAARWRSREPERVRVIESDALAFDVASLGSGLRIFGNLPYNISSPLLFHLMDAAAHVQDQHFMLQKEVVARMVAAPACADYGRMSVMLQWRYRMWNILNVGPDSFSPPPRVDSAVVRMLPRPEQALLGLDPARLKALTAAAFAQRRKLLRHALEPWLQAQGYGGAFDLQRRAEEVSVQDYVSLALELPAISRQESRQEPPAT
ncbi:MAG: 16S rRNA (adenine(1518)-N(6)/adenine(1519)-N(6))-dimethyltransferase RsmA [Betaproteobacteria bacterium]|nr:16S rRNA (adenine(1518)-N(6)/adenine(1519)-N(6))-dimethyltransferase RsmA [Betaproteobacteria bacterium]